MVLAYRSQAKAEEMFRISKSRRPACGGRPIIGRI